MVVTFCGWSMARSANADIICGRLRSWTKNFDVSGRDGSTLSNVRFWPEIGMSHTHHAYKRVCLFIPVHQHYFIALTISSFKFDQYLIWLHEVGFMSCNIKPLLAIQWSLYFTTVYFKTTLIIRPPNLAPKCNFEYYWTFILGPPAV